MSSFVSRQAGSPTVVDDDEGYPFVITNMNGTHGRQLDGPQAYYVKVPMGATIRPHFHTVDQYQVVTAGAGTLGRHTVGPGFVHYVDAYTPYGPIRAADEAFEYLTLRPSADAGINFMPGSRDKRVRRDGRQLVGHISVQPDGLCAYVLDVEPGAEARPTPVPRSCAAHLLIVRGTVGADGDTFGEGATLFVRGDEELPALRAGAVGAGLLVLHYPDR